MGIGIITTVLRAASATTPAKPYDLIDLASAKDELSIPEIDHGNDTFLRRAITQVSKIIAQAANRVFPIEGVEDVSYYPPDACPALVPGGIFALQLSRWPIVPDEAVIELTGDTHGTTTIDALSDTDGLMVGTPISGPGISTGATIAAIDVAAASLTLSIAATASAAGVHLATGLVAIQMRTPSDLVPLVRGTDYEIDSDKGWLIKRNPLNGAAERWPAIPMTVQYAAGYDEIPEDLAEACLRLVTARFRARGRDPMLMNQEGPGLGPQRWWIGAAPGQKGSLPPEIAAVVDNYRPPAI